MWTTSMGNDGAVGGISECRRSSCSSFNWFLLRLIITCRLWLSMWGKIIIPMYRSWLHDLYGLYGPRCPLSPKRPINLISLSLSLSLSLAQAEQSTIWMIQSKLSKITRPVAAIKSLRFALFKVIRQISRSHGTKESQNLTQIRRFRTVTPVWIHRWIWNDAQSFT